MLPLYSSLRGLFCGSGLGAMGDPWVAEQLLSLLPAERRSSSSVLYLGTATYDAEEPYLAQTACLRAAGCRVTSLPLVASRPSREESDAAIASADIIIVSGGNSLYMLDLWRMTGVDAALQAAVARGVVFGGGSAGIGWLFDGVHSDSADATTFRHPLPASSDWSYVRVPALGILPGLVTPHADQTQSNGILRRTDAEAMLRRHAGERLWAVDHWAALQCDGAGGVPRVRAARADAPRRRVPGHHAHGCWT